MPKIYNVIIVLSFLCLWIESYFSAKLQLIVGFIFIFTFGIFHGANDLLLIQKINLLNKSFSYLKILLFYVFFVLIGAGFFYILPALALFLFVIISGYHFGEQQWQFLDILKIKYLQYVFQLIYGVFILLLLFNFNKEEVQNVIFTICQYAIPLQFFVTALIIVGCILAMMLLYLFIIEQAIQKQIILEIFYLLMFTIIFMTSTLIWSFAIYFILWHSLPSIVDQTVFLFNDVNKNSFKLYFKSAFLYWIASLIGIAILYLVFKDEKIFNALFFSFLAVITFPHVFVILKMFKSRYEDTKKVR